MEFLSPDLLDIGRAARWWSWDALAALAVAKDGSLLVADDTGGNDHNAHRQERPMPAITRMLPHRCKKTDSR